MTSLPHKKQKEIEFKGMFYNNNPQHQFYEGGAHFSFKELVNKLTTLTILLSKENENPTVNEINNINYHTIVHRNNQDRTINVNKGPCPIKDNNIILKESKKHNKGGNLQILSSRQNAIAKDFVLPKMAIPHNSTKIAKKIFVSKDKNYNGILIQNNDKRTLLNQYKLNENESLKQLLNASSLAAAMINRNVSASNLLAPIQLNNNISKTISKEKTKKKKIISTRNHRHDDNNNNKVNSSSVYMSCNEIILKPIHKNLNGSIIIPKRNLNEIDSTNNDNNNNNNHNENHMAKKKILLQLGNGNSRNNKNNLNIMLKKSNSLLMHKTSFQKNTPHHVIALRSKQII